MSILTDILDKGIVFDIGIVLFIAIFAIAGAKQGVIKGAVSLVGIIIVFLVAFQLKDQFGNFLCKYFPFFTFKGELEGLVSINILIYQLLAFIIIIVLLLSVYGILTTVSGLLQKLVNATIILKLPSAIGGFIIGVLEGYLFAFLILLFLILPFQNFKMYKNSYLVNTIVYKSPILSSSTSNVTNSITDIYTVADKVVNKKISTNDANLQIIDTMIKYDITTAHTVEQLVILDKLEGVKGIDKVIAKYK